MQNNDEQVVNERSVDPNLRCLLDTSIRTTRCVPDGGLHVRVKWDLVHAVHVCQCDAVHCCLQQAKTKTGAWERPRGADLARDANPHTHFTCAKDWVCVLSCSVHVLCGMTVCVQKKQNARTKHGNPGHLHSVTGFLPAQQSHYHPTMHAAQRLVNGHFAVLVCQMILSTNV